MSARQQLSSLRNRLRIEEGEATRSASAYASAGVIGLMKAGGQLDRVPSVFGLPKTVGVAIAAKLGASYAPKNIGHALNGLGDAAACIAIYEFAQGMTVSGMHGSASDAAERLEARLQAQLDEDELAAIEEELAAVRR